MLALPGPRRQVLLEVTTTERRAELRRVLAVENDRLVDELLSL